jgi:hypothetical protein
MRTAKLTAVCSALGLSLIGFGAGAQIPDVDQPIDAKILETDAEARTMTVQFEANGETMELYVAEDADLKRTGPHDLERPIALSDIHPGAEVNLEYSEVDGQPTLLILYFRES